MPLTLPARPAADRTMTGMALMLAFCLVAPLLDVSAKLATATLPLAVIVLARMVVQGVLTAPLVTAMGIGWRTTRRQTLLLALRAALLAVSTLTFVAAVAVMPIADALAIVFVEPFILLVLGHLIFGDSVGPRRIAASLVGFAGAMLIIQPSLAVFGTVALYPLATAFLFAAYMLVTRALRDLHPVAQQAQTSLWGTAMTLPVVLWLYPDAAAFPVPQGLAWLWLFGVGFWAAVSHMAMSYALRFAPAATLAPLHYFEIVVAVALGYLIWGDFPTPQTWVGIAVITGSGLYIIHRERLRMRRG
jgi:drug/metabolite transporter (DMT)-like permease